MWLQLGKWRQPLRTISIYLEMAVGEGIRVGRLFVLVCFWYLLRMKENSHL